MSSDHQEKKYTIRDMDLSKLVHKREYSNAWKGIIFDVDVLHKRVRVEVKNGASTLFWRDCRLGDHSLSCNALQPITLANSFKRVKDYWSNNHGWNWDTLEPFLTIQTLIKLVPILISSDENVRDEICWRLTPTGRFTTKLAYELAVGNESGS